MTLEQNLHRVLNKLARWRTVLASWQLGTRNDTDGECKAVKNHWENSLMQRAELSATTALLIRKGVFTLDEFRHQLIEEAGALDQMYEAFFKGFRTTDVGIEIITQQAAETAQELGFPE